MNNVFHVLCLKHYQPVITEGSNEKLVSIFFIPRLGLGCIMPFQFLCQSVLLVKEIRVPVNHHHINSKVYMVLVHNI